MRRGRTTVPWGRRGARWDPGPTNRWRSYPPRHAQPKEPEVPEPKIAGISGRPGAAERDLHMELAYNPDVGERTLSLKTQGWYDATIELNERQARFLRDRLNEWLPED